MSATSDHRSADVDSVLEMFRTRGGRITMARREIVTALLTGSDHHLTAEQIAAAVHARSPEISMSTVYRSLEILEGLGVLEHIHLGHGPAVYHRSDQQHVHLICKQCGTIAEMPDTTLLALGREIQRRHGFAVDLRHLAINGLCRHCRAGSQRGSRTRDAESELAPREV